MTKREPSSAVTHSSIKASTSPILTGSLVADFGLAIATTLPVSSIGCGRGAGELVGAGSSSRRRPGAAKNGSPNASTVQAKLRSPAPMRSNPHAGDTETIG
jgi:hypothetical protein